VSSLVEIDSGDGVLRWELCRPERRNAIDPDGLRWIARRCATLRGEIVIFSGRGDEAFCAGFDLDALEGTADGSAPPDRPLVEAVDAMERADATFVARIGGYVIGAGVELCCACDLRVARRGVRFSIPAGRLGVVYHLAGVSRILRTFGPALCRSLLLLGRSVDDIEADRAGAFVALVEADGLDAAIEAVVSDLRASDPEALRSHRSLLRTLACPSVPDDVRAEHERRREAAYRRLDPATARARMRPR
jgi:enoyl-CoA hydratase/carnithine racemase